MNYQPTPSVGFIEAGKLYFKNATNFSGRARRSEYWMAMLFLMVVNLVGGFVLSFVLGLLGEVGMAIYGILYAIWGIYCMIASLSLCIRRYHDTGRSGWWCLLAFVPVVGSIVLLVFCCLDSTEDNKWGPNPKFAPSRREEVFEYTPPQPTPVPAYEPEVDEDKTVITPILPKPTPEISAPAQLQGVAQIQSGPMAGKTFKFPEGTVVTVGRDPAQCNLVLPSYSMVSGVHCKLHFGKRVITVMDTNSTNGTFIDGNRLQPGKPVAFRDQTAMQLANANCSMKLWFE